MLSELDPSEIEESEFAELSILDLSVLDESELQVLMFLESLEMWYDNEFAPPVKMHFPLEQLPQFQ